MRKIPVTLAALLLCSTALAQNISARIAVRDENSLPVSNATLQIRRLPDSALLQTKTLTTAAVLSLKANSDYLFRVTAVGIEELFSVIHTGLGDTVIVLTARSKTKSLDAVTVTARKPLITQSDDKTIVDAEVLASSSTNAFEVLEKTPGAVTDQDGNVYLNSATPATIYINGREIKLGSNDLASLLKSLPANSVSKIEILRTPSAKYDASGSGGIVNIVLKKGVKLGLNGSAEVSHFQGVLPTNSIGFNLNNNDGKLNSYVSGNYTDRTNFEVLTSQRPSDSILFSQNSYTRYPNRNMYLGGGLDYQLSEKWNLGYDGRLSANKNRSNARNEINIFDSNSGAKEGTNVSTINNSGPSRYFGNEFSANYKIDSAGSKLENSLNVNFFRSRNSQVYGNEFLFPVSFLSNGDGNNQNRRNILIFQTDLLEKLKNKYTLEAGGKITYSNSRNVADYFRTNYGIRTVDTFQSSRFTYRENISALYLQVAKTFGGLTVKPGLRLENTDQQGHQVFPQDTSFKIRRTDLFPYVYLRHGLFKLFGFMLTGNAIYRRSITRPSYDQLNPYPRFVDQYTFDVGNPELQPQFTTNYEFNITADEFPVFAFGVNKIHNIFNNLTFQKDRILFRTSDNLGDNREIYLRFTGGIPPGGKYFFYAGGQMNSVNYRGFYGNAPFGYKNTAWTFFMFHNYKPMPSLNLSMHGFMRTNSLINFFQLKTFGGLTLSANKTMLKKKMNLVVAVNDIFRTNRNEFSIDVPGFSADGLRYGDTRRLGITLRYNFGIKPKEDKKESFDAPTEVQ